MWVCDGVHLPGRFQGGGRWGGHAPGARTSGGPAWWPAGGLLGWVGTNNSPMVARVEADEALSSFGFATSSRDGRGAREGAAAAHSDLMRVPTLAPQSYQQSHNRIIRAAVPAAATTPAPANSFKPAAPLHQAPLAAAAVAAAAAAAAAAAPGSRLAARGGW